MYICYVYLGVHKYTSSLPSKKKNEKAIEKIETRHNEKS